MPNKERDQQESLAARNINRGYVEISIDSVPLRIPIEYVAKWQPYLDGEKNFFSFGLYRNLTPNQHILGPVRAVIGKKNTNYIGDRESLYKAHRVEPDGISGPFGLLVHPLRNEFQKTYSYIEVYSFPIEDNYDLIIKCIHGLCTSKFRNMDNLSINYSFYIDQLENW